MCNYTLQVVAGLDATFTELQANGSNLGLKLFGETISWL